MSQARSIKQSIELLQVMTNKKTLDECKVLGKKPKKRKHEETDEQVALFQWAKLQECIYPQLRWMYAIPNGGSRNKIEAKNLQRQGVKSGVSDICLPTPKRCKETGQIMCCGLYIEMKSKKGVVSDNQREFLQFVNGQDYYGVVVYSWEEAKNIILEYLNG